MGHVYFCDLACDRAPKLFCADSHHARLPGLAAAKPSNYRIAYGFRLLLRPCLRFRPKAFGRRLTLRTLAWLDSFETFELQSSIVHVHFCELVGDRFPKHFFADSHHARLLGLTAAKPVNRKVAGGTFTSATLFATASQSVFAQTHMTLACLIRPPNLQFAE